jgi:hypothetical protein
MEKVKQGKRKRVFHHPPVDEIRGLTEDQINSIRKQPNADVLFTVYSQITEHIEQNKTVRLYRLWELTGLKKNRIRRAMVKLETLLYSESA